MSAKKSAVVVVASIGLTLSLFVFLRVSPTSACLVLRKGVETILTLSAFIGG